MDAHLKSAFAVLGIVLLVSIIGVWLLVQQETLGKGGTTLTLTSQKPVKVICKFNKIPDNFKGGTVVFKYEYRPKTYTMIRGTYTYRIPTTIQTTTAVIPVGVR